MSLRPTLCRDVPAATAAVAHAAFPHGNPYLRLRDHLGTIFSEAQFASLFAPCGQPAECPWRLALVSLLQFAENLSDRRAADAVRSRIDWKYLLGLELTDPGFDASVLSEFRSRVVAGGLEERLLDTLLALCRENKLLRARGRQRTGSERILRSDFPEGERTITLRKLRTGWRVKPVGDGLLRVKLSPSDLSMNVSFPRLWQTHPNERLAAKICILGNFQARERPRASVGTRAHDCRARSFCLTCVSLRML
ncbi:hypothetical protein BB934_25630 [Microvirga ossetica]|uniref:Transposase InsH N-terminal domain-containing protein n=1 Tax=Microvirga ossetica TaxID=1882682 RepID=A0A1B2EMI5_9HYPH|nr:hypothetical protein BB934_25630 [Microvirga ossetica]